MMPKSSRVSSVKTSTAFDTSYNLLNPAQRKAVDTIEGPVMVIAGPGTGKTTILTLRIANILLRTDTAPENILALTFTESGAFAMRKKLLDIIGPAAYKVNIHTFHGFSGRLIEQYPDYFPRMIGSAIVTEAEQIKIIEGILSARTITLLRPYGDPSYYIRPILGEIHHLKRENISPQAFAVSVEADKVPETNEKGKKLSATEIEKIEKRLTKNRELAFVYEQYERILAENKQYDFDDMLLELIRVMEADQNFKLILQESFQYILADEHQDANAAQNRILELLSDFHDMPNLYIVGDDKQAIYRFQGASLENFLYFKQKYTGATIVDLEHNYRSHQLILDASHSLILNNPTIPGHERTKLRSLQVGGRPIRVAELADMADELEYAAQTIKKLIEKKEKPEEIAIIYRENNHAQRIAQVLKSHGISYRVESDHDILHDPDVMKLILICRAIHDPSNSEALAAALWMPEFKCDPADVSSLCSLSNRERVPLHTLIKVKGKKAFAAPEIRVAYNQITEWSHEARILPFLDLLDLIIQGTNMLSAIVASPLSVERLASIETFYERMSRVASSKRTFLLKDCIEYLDIVGTHGISSKRGHTDHISGVRLMTAHRSKGLEFNYVFILHAADGIWGNRRSRSLFTIPVIEHTRDAGRIEDERRLFYVALTRAREGIHISYSRSDGERDLIPSQFVSEIDADLLLLETPELGRKVGKLAQRLASVPISKERSLLNIDFVRSKFLSQPLSVTHLNNYLACPWRYFFVNLVRIPQAQSKQQMYGTAVHGALRSYFEAYRNEHDLTIKQLIDTFRRNLERLPLSQDDREDSLEKGKRALTGYVRAYESTWKRNLLTEYSVRGVEIDLEDGELPHNGSKLALTGNLDKIEFINSGEVIVTDFKTGKPKSRNEIEGKTREGAGDYKRQLTFYKLLLASDSKKLRMTYGEIDFIEPNERGIYKKEQFEISDEEVEELRDVIRRVGQEVLSLSFIESVCDDKKCQYCALGKILAR
jgi:DNA helicase II / ATP-dependent DNA helicase PcrA